MRLPARYFRQKMNFPMTMSSFCVSLSALVDAARKSGVRIYTVSLENR
jgi:hypothetical protein